MLSIDKISKSFGDRVMFDDLTFNVADGDRIALVGPNGSGKTTLLNIIAGEGAPDTGNITKNSKITIGYLKQEPDRFFDKSLLQEVLESSEEVNNIMDRITSIHESLSDTISGDNQEKLLKELIQLDKSLEEAGGGFRDHEAKEILTGLGFKTKDFDRPIGEFSGGWLMRASLGKLLFGSPDVLLLDEPTNHLDLDANLWFEKYINSFRGGVIITSHDRTFLNQISSMVLAIEPDGIILQRGNYDDYLVARERSLEIKQAAAARQEREIQRQMRFVERFRSKARKASLVQIRLKQIVKIEQIQLP